MSLIHEEEERASILIVDDLPEKLLVFGSVLEELGQNLVFARSGNEALREVLKQEFAVILLDVNMPDIDGFETASLIRRYRRSAHTPIIFITAYADEMQTARGYSLGAVDYILSPVVPEILCSKIKVFIDLFLLQRRTRRQADERVALAAAEAARRAAEENTRRSSFLARASRQLGDCLDVDIAIRRLLELVVPELADVAVVFPAEADGGAQRIQMACCTAPEHPAFIAEVPQREWAPSILAVCTQARAHRRAMDLPAADMERFNKLVSNHAAVRMGRAAPALGRAVLQPLVAGERVLGLLLLASANPRDWSVLDELAGRMAIALENSRLYAVLQAEIVERRAAEEKLQMASQRKDEFLAMLSHELRNPLAPISNAVEVIRRLAPPDTKLRWANEVMGRQVRHLTRLVEELLDVARISQGKITLHLEQVDLLAVIEHSVETARPFIEQREHHLELQLPPGPLWMRGDFARLSQVIANLLSNSAKYTETGGHLKLAVSTLADQAIITVSDDGIGIEPELLPHVFDLFEQGRRSLDRSQGGLGVGLTLVQRLVQLHQGRVEVRSDGLGQGAEFRVYLPCVEQPARPAPEVVRTASAPNNAPCKVLIVDDNADAAESVAMVLQLQGHEVKTVLDGAQALACIGSYAPQAVVLDIGLPGLDGYDVARLMRRTEVTRHALLIALTGYGQRDDVTRATEAGFDHHFVKPADPLALAACIAQASLKADATVGHGSDVNLPADAKS